MNKTMIIALVIVFALFPVTSAGFPTVGELDTVLYGYHYPYGYQRNVYDCSDMSTTLAMFLQYYYGWNTSIAIKEDFDGECHAWVVVETSPNRWTAIESTYSPLRQLGTRVYTTDYYTGINELIEWYEADLYMR